MKRKELKRQLKSMKKKYQKLRESVSQQYGLTEYDMDCLEKYGCTREIWDNRIVVNKVEEELPF